MDEIDPHIHLIIVYLGVFPAGIAYIFWSLILQKVEPTRAVTLLYITPIATSLMAYFTLGELLNTGFAIGATITLFGVMVNKNQFNWSSYKKWAMKFHNLQKLGLSINL